MSACLSVCLYSHTFDSLFIIHALVVSFTRKGWMDGWMDGGVSGALLFVCMMVWDYDIPWEPFMLYM